jgi:recombinational DNA repair protein (RecF pathway)
MRAECQRAAHGAGLQPNLSPCALCGTAAATFRCTTHGLRICPACVPRHDDHMRCLYKSSVADSAPVRRVLAFPARG